MNYKQKIQELEQQIEALKQEMENPPVRAESHYWWPSDEEQYWVLYPSCSHKNITNETAKKHSRAHVGGLFKTEKERDVFKKVNDTYYNLMAGIELDWCNNDCKKWLFVCNHPFHDPHAREESSHPSPKISVQATYVSLNQYQGTNYMTKPVCDEMRELFTDEELKIWVLGGAKR